MLRPIQAPDITAPGRIWRQLALVEPTQLGEVVVDRASNRESISRESRVETDRARALVRRDYIRTYVLFPARG